ncbi:MULTISPECIES: 5-amino-6-(D-ribitylamino)uracil--L-tyrosine 4-hydroxyphenyl transferase CofH [unclassified Sphingomonas]|uniref:5-amino-6-(D-ribitylamino)uracil--L-tyrosine 4-hydroxyphenyl transferase CofH n=1 Tax=unclassified Sphingomonas TaxID=196159 RepID=UPI0006F207A3|nr:MULTISPECIES: 5-amino-6-(D-ribitylamino)uracil--L-tyrosine 4-hydroxyphenyl transferase CofH [unclassified Sphingomonas]KQX17649.1 2-phospho-L-lactate guanylyltransferase [Sphingomonas sp. Root1294]KQY70575.1 2-phospho-L-lactate guanylyltransferase [Sphingomonas sp. Root50]KRB91936.1 2-phospho-L-lactate guanylyltransferase [Sphingomonas sp. Root720]
MESGISPTPDSADPYTGLSDDALRSALLAGRTDELLPVAARLRDAGHGRVQSWSPKVFVPLTQLCRNLCHYCTFSQPPRRGEAPYLDRAAVLEIARAGLAAGCTEALFTLGDKPELRFAAARDALAGLGHATTLSYLAEMCAAVRDETGLLPHVNAGVMNRAELAALRPVAASMGLMLESVSERLCAKGGPHYRSPDKMPAARLETIRIAGELAIPFTTGILIGIGETRAERIDALLAIRDLHRRHGHIQEVIVQNFRAKPRTAMAEAPEPDMDDLLWTIAAARILLGPAMNIQAPPNLSAGDFPRLIDAGINDWGGISPVTPDHVNPEAPWPEVDRLRAATAEWGRILVARLPAYPGWGSQGIARWQDPAMAGPLLAAADASGFARADRWSPGLPLPDRAPEPVLLRSVDPDIAAITARAMAGEAIGEDHIVRLFAARDADLDHVCAAADALRRQVNGDTVTYVVNRNINYTNICLYKCGFCAFSKGDKAEALRGRPYDLDREEVIRRAREAWARGGTEVCLQGGIHPHYTGDTYLDLAHAVRTAVPDVHIHAFSPLEVAQGAATLGLPVTDFLARLKAAGLDTLPGTAAEILDDEVRAQICPDKLTSDEWIEVVGAAHDTGFRTTATIMFGHVDAPRHWARHLLRIRALQARTGGFTEFVPLPFVPMEAPMALRGQARRGPTFREVRLMHAVARLALHPLVTSIQASWVKLGPAGVAACLRAGANDLGGTLMNESISRAAGTRHGQEMPPEAMDALIRSIGRTPRQRTTLYGDVADIVRRRGRNAAALTPMILTPPIKRRATRKNEMESLNDGR